MYGEKAKLVFEKLRDSGLIDAKGQIKLSLLGLEVIIDDKSAVGNLLQEWLGFWMKQNGIYYRTDENTQVPPDFYLSETNDKDWLEVKTFDYNECPNFDVAQFDAYVRDIIEKPYRLDADYLILGYTLENGILQVHDIWLRKIWTITCPSNDLPLRTQRKQGKIHNIRPYNFKTNSSVGFQPFKTRLEFVRAIQGTLNKYDGAVMDGDEWFNKIKNSYENFTKKPL